MAEAAAEKPQTLAEQYFVKENEENPDLSTKTEEVKELENPKEVAAEQAVEATAVVAPAVTEISSEVTPAAAEESVAPPAAEESKVTPAAAEESVAPPAAEESDATEEKSGVQEAEEDTEEFKLETAPIDFRFPTTNQTRHCFTRYIEYHRCTAARGEDAPECDKFAKYYRSLCPGEWIEKWNEQRENGTFPGPL